MFVSKIKRHISVRVFRLGSYLGANAETKEQMTAAAKAIGSPGLKSLTLHMNYSYDWDSDNEFSRLPPRLNDERSKLTLIDLSGALHNTKRVGTSIPNYL